VTLIARCVNFANRLKFAPLNRFLTFAEVLLKKFILVTFVALAILPSTFVFGESLSSEFMQGMISSKMGYNVDNRVIVQIRAVHIDDFDKLDVFLAGCGKLTKEEFAKVIEIAVKDESRTGENTLETACRVRDRQGVSEIVKENLRRNNATVSARTTVKAADEESEFNKARQMFASRRLPLTRAGRETLDKLQKMVYSPDPKEETLARRSLGRFARLISTVDGVVLKRAREIEVGSIRDEVLHQAEETIEIWMADYGVQLPEEKAAEAEKNIVAALSGTGNFAKMDVRVAVTSLHAVIVKKADNGSGLIKKLTGK